MNQPKIKWPLRHIGGEEAEPAPAPDPEEKPSDTEPTVQDRILSALAKRYGMESESVDHALLLQKLEETEALEAQKDREHGEALARQAEAVKEKYPAFDLEAEMQNPVFARMIAPGVGIGVEDAYWAIHRNELQTAALRETAEKTAEKITNAILSGSRRPSEAGSTSQAPTVSTFDYAKASPKQREDFKKDLRLRMAKGEKVYPERG